MQFDSWCRQRGLNPDIVGDVKRHGTYTRVYTGGKWRTVYGQAPARTVVIGRRAS